jgi:methionyl-tRNA formyltransferase
MMTNREEIVLYLTGKKGLVVLSNLVDKGYSSNISKVVVAQDKGVEEDYSEQIKELAQRRSINVLNRADAEVGVLSGKYAFAVAWRWLIETTNYETIIVFHDSLLPKYRGFAPLVAQLIKGETKIGVTAIMASTGYDEGPILSQESTEIEYPIKVEMAIDVVSGLYARQIETIFEKILQKEALSFIPQEEAEATYSIWRDEEDLSIDWSLSNNQIKRFVDATGFPFKGAYTKLEDERIVISEVELITDLKLEFRHVGKTIRFEEGDPVVICGDGLIRIRKATWHESQEEIIKWPMFRMKFV